MKVKIVQNPPNSMLSQNKKLNLHEKIFHSRLKKNNFLGVVPMLSARVHARALFNVAAFSR